MALPLPNKVLSNYGASESPSRRSMSGLFSLRKLNDSLEPKPAVGLRMPSPEPSELSPSDKSAVSECPRKTFGRGFSTRAFGLSDIKDRKVGSATSSHAVPEVMKDAEPLNSNDSTLPYFHPSNTLTYEAPSYANMTCPNVANGRTESGPELTGLYVRNIPLDMKKESLHNMFSQYGTVVSVFLKNKPDNPAFTTTFAIVKVPSKREAMKMIDGLNDVPPFKFKVEVALTQEERNKRNSLKIKRTDEDPFYSHEQKVRQEPVDNTRTTSAFDQRKGSLFAASNSSIGAPKPKVEPQISSPAPVPRTSSISSLGNRDNDDEAASIAGIDETYQPQLNGRSQSGQPQSVLEVDTSLATSRPSKECVSCKSPALLRCSVCKAGYCSSECQHDDWYYHQRTCTQPPPLEPVTSPRGRPVADACEKQLTDKSLGKSQEIADVKQSLPQSHEIKNTIIYESTEMNQTSTKVIHSIADGKKAISDHSVQEAKKGTLKLEDKKTPSKQPVKPNHRYIESVCHNLIVGQEYTGVITSMQDSMNFSMLLTVNASSSLLNEVHPLLLSAPYSNNYKASVGDYVCARSSFDAEEESWCRAYVYGVSGSSYSICLIDFGCTEVTSMVKPLPAGKCLSVSSVGVVCSQSTPTIKNDSLQLLKSVYDNNSMLEFKVIGRDGDVLKILIFNENQCEVGEYLMHPWFALLDDATIPQPNTTSAEVNSKSEISELATAVKTNVSDSAKNDTEMCKTKALAKPVEFFSINSLRKKHLDIGQKYSVRPVWCEGDFLFVQSGTAEEHQQAQMLMANIADYCESSKCPDEVSVGEVICAYIKSDQLWYRALVLKAGNADSIDVYLVDFGNVLTVSLSAVRSILPALLEMPLMCFKVALTSATKADEIMTGVSKVILNLVKDFTAMTMEVTGKLTSDSADSFTNPLLLDTYVVILHIDETGECVNSKCLPLEPKLDIKDEILEDPQHKSNVIWPPSEICGGASNDELRMPAHAYYEDCEIVTLEPGENVKLIVLSTINTHSIMVLPFSQSSLMEKLEELSVHMNEYCNSIAPTYYKPVEGEIVLAKFSEDGKWYRAACLQIGEKAVALQFVDYGNIEVVPFESIVQMIKAFVKPLKFLAAHTILKGAGAEPNDATEAIDRLKELLPMFTVVTADHVSPRDPDTLAYTVTLSNVEAVLKKENLI